MILIECVSASSCRGWEGNEVEYVEFDGTLREFLIKEYGLDADDLTEEMVEDNLNGTIHEAGGFGFVEGGDETGYDYEGEEVCVSYRVVHPKQARKMIKLLEKYSK